MPFVAVRLQGEIESGSGIGLEPQPNEIGDTVVTQIGDDDTLFDEGAPFRLTLSIGGIRRRAGDMPGKRGTKAAHEEISPGGYGCWLRDGRGGIRVDRPGPVINDERIHKGDITSTFQFLLFVSKSTTRSHEQPGEGIA
ncbi:MAG TPA: hypothetical protein VNT30_10365 [Stellaceae bacterium]|nr:hypothetical protein [Stellaceae bacterium]